MHGQLRLAVAVVAGLLVGAGAVSGAVGSSAQSRWGISDLGTLGGRYSSAVAINQRGQIVGTSLTKDGASHVFVWENGKQSDLGDIGGPVAINGRGQVLVNRQVWEHVALSDQLVASQSFVWDRGRVTQLAPMEGRDLVVATAINDRGQVIGTSSAKNGSGAAGFFWDAGHMTDLDLMPVSLDSSGRVLGNGKDGPHLWQRGEIRPLVWACRSVVGTTERGFGVGQGSTRNGTVRVCVWQNGKTTLLPTLGYDAVPIVVNDNGWVFGYSYVTKATPRVQHYVVWRKGKPTDLGAFDNSLAMPSEIFKMNDRGQLVWSVDDYKSEHVFVWENGRTTTLPTLGGKEVMASAVNDHGQIVGYSTTKNGDRHAVLWTLRSNT
jgi:probable HAF family extracellular repeat protein